MIIKLDNFTIQPNDVSPQSWDVTEEVVTKKKDGTAGVKENSSYSVPLEHALKIVIGSRLAKNVSVVDLKEYLIEYKKEKEELSKLINETLKIK